MALQNVCIFWYSGKVWKTLVDQILKHDGSDKGHLNPTRIVWLVRNWEYMLDERWFGRNYRYKFASDALKYDTHEEIMNALLWLWFDQDVIFVDCTADKQIWTFHNHIVWTRNKIVTANKNPLSLWTTDDFIKLTRDRSLYRYNASVMAWWDAVPLLQDLYDTSDPVLSIQWCFSGTLGYICSQLEQNQPFSSIVKDAKDKGYTEPNPWDDLNWLDVARKLLILARSAGFRAEMKDIQVEPFIDSKFWEIAPEFFLKSIKELDEPFKQRVNELSNNNQVLRYVWEITRAGDTQCSISVGLKPVSREDNLWSLKWTTNFIKITSEIALKDGQIIQTAWAGLEKTAHAIRRDLAQLLKGRTAKI